MRVLVRPARSRTKEVPELLQAVWEGGKEVKKKRAKLLPGTQAGTLPHPLPCGCSTTAARMQTIRLANGHRICKHGREWQAVAEWVEVKK